MYRITSEGPDGMNRTMTAYPDEAIRQAQIAVAEGRTQVWIADDNGRLFSVEAFGEFIQAGS
jgi:hypothetical protein